MNTWAQVSHGTEDLLDQMARTAPKRRAVLSEGLRDSLATYLAFRHFSRYATAPILGGRRQHERVVLSVPDSICTLYV